MKKVVTNLFIDNENKCISCLDKGGNSIEVLKHQGDLDGSCATYGVVMNLLMLQAIYDSDTRLDSNPNGKNGCNPYKKTDHIRTNFGNFVIQRINVPIVSL